MSSPEARRDGLRVVSDATRSGPREGAVLHLDLTGMSYGRVPVLGGIDLSVSPGETLAITGASGIGKTTLLRILAGLETGFTGRLQRPENVSFVFQEPTLLPWRTALDNICLAAGVDKSQAVAALEEVGLGGRGSSYPDQLSLGQQRRLSLARAFASSPDLLLMDEPFVSLDPEIAEDMMVLFARLRAVRQVATVLVTHVEDEAKKLASRIVTLAGTPAVITSERQNKGAYFQLSASGVTSSKS